MKRRDGSNFLLLSLSHGVGKNGLHYSRDEFRYTSTVNIVRGCGGKKEDIATLRQKTSGRSSEVQMGKLPEDFYGVQIQMLSRRADISLELFLRDNRIFFVNGRHSL